MDKNGGKREENRGFSAKNSKVLPPVLERWELEHRLNKVLELAGREMLLA